jgi:hypothetical protein
MALQRCDILTKGTPSAEAKMSAFPLSEERVVDSSDEDERVSSDNDSEASSTTPEASANLRRLTGAKIVPVAVTIPAQIFKAPKGYDAIAPPAVDCDSSAQPLGDLPEKQLWQITVPAGVPLESVKELDVEAVLRGEPFLTHNGISYGMQPLPTTDDAFVLEQGSDGKYQQASKKIERNFLIQEIHKQTTLPSEADLPPAFTATEAGGRKEVRKQPTGLKMRNTPFGVAAEPATKVSEDTDMLNPSIADSSFQPSKGSAVTKIKEKGAAKRKRD